MALPGEFRLYVSRNDPGVARQGDIDTTLGVSLWRGWGAQVSLQWLTTIDLGWANPYSGGMMTRIGQCLPPAMWMAGCACCCRVAKEGPSGHR